MLFKWACAMRAMTVRVGRSLVLGVVNALIHDTECAQHFKHKEARKSWYSSWKRSLKLKEVRVARIELSRKKWCTAANIKL